MKKHYETHVEDTDKLISVAGPVLDYKSWYEQYRKLMEEQAQRKYGLYTPTSEGDDDDFPSIPGMIARYSASGLTNEQMKENPVWVDKTGNGHDLQMKNFLWGGMSGVGGYKLNWGDSSIWVNYITQGTFGTGEVTDNTIHITSAKTNNALFETRASLKSVEYKVLIKGLTDDIYLHYGVFNDGKELWTEIKNDGIYTLPSYDYDSRYNMKWKVMSQTYPIDCNITIEQLPLYPGFILGDGVDDFAVTEKELNFEDTYTVYTAFIPFQNNPTRNMILCGADSKKTFSMQYSSLVYVTFIAGNNYYINADFVNGLNLFACKRNGNNICIKNLLTNKVVTGTCGDWVENAGLYCLWKNATYISFAKAAIAGQTICNGYFSTDEDDEKVLDWYKKQYPWLFPDQAWTTVGKTNEDKDRATIANITGNGNNLVLSNFGFAEGSGYGLYAYNFNSFALRDNVVKPTDVKKDSFRIIGIGDKGNVLVLSNTSNSAAWKIRITGMKEGDSCIVGNANKSGDYIKIIKDGVYTFQKQYAATSINGIWYNSSQEVDVLVEQIPEYEGYLITDGVDDKAVSKQFKFGENFTVILDFKFPVKKISYCGFDLSSKVRIQNLQGSGVYVVLKGNKTLIPSNVVRAVTSEGKVYDENWNEYNIVPGNISSNYTMVNLDFDGSNQFAESATKLAGIYSSTLSKDDCIKAYNYLQTLKAK
jgi:hypothetical protein